MANYGIRVRAGARYDARRPVLDEVVARCTPDVQTMKLNVHLYFEAESKRYSIENEGLWIGGAGTDFEKQRADMVISRQSLELSDLAFKGLLYHAICMPEFFWIAQRQMPKVFEKLQAGTINSYIVDAKIDILVAHYDAEALVRYKAETLMLDGIDADGENHEFDAYCKVLKKSQPDIVAKILEHIRKEKELLADEV